ncbi:cd81 antigen [Clonorchis sinensis]|uniref:Tetraspanin n=1 Tax=Clonorchis sinensis TaxID=79923 RepID=A0A8T1MQ56_CLOSI|nr:cd81 antigen [Clonorchis sinensis]
MCTRKATVKCIKTLLVVFNLLFVLLGLILVGLSCRVLLAPVPLFGSENPEVVHLGACTVLAFGLILAALAFVGCIGAALDNRCLLITFFTVLCGIFTGGLVAGVLVAVFKDEIFTLMVNRLSIAVQHDYGVSGVWTECIDLIQSKLQCCAIDDYQATLYSRSVWYHRQHIGLQQEGPALDRENQLTLRPIKVPASCCLRTADNLHYMNLKACQRGPLDPIHNQYIHARGCSTALAEFFQNFLVLFVVVPLVLLGFLATGLAFSIMLLRG